MINGRLDGETQIKLLLSWLCPFRSVTRRSGSSPNWIWRTFGMSHVATTVFFFISWQRMRWIFQPWQTANNGFWLKCNIKWYSCVSESLCKSAHTSHHFFMFRNCICIYNTMRKSVVLLMNNSNFDRAGFVSVTNGASLELNYGSEVNVYIMFVDMAEMYASSMWIGDANMYCNDFTHTQKEEEQEWSDLIHICNAAFEWSGKRSNHKD